MRRERTDRGIRAEVRLKCRQEQQRHQQAGAESSRAKEERMNTSSRLISIATHFARDEDVLALDASSFQTFFDTFSAFDLVSATRVPQYLVWGPRWKCLLDLGQIKMTVAVFNPQLCPVTKGIRHTLA